MTDETTPRDLGSWAGPVERIDVGDNAKRLMGPLQGFGKMWQKTFHIRLEGADVTPQRVISEWKDNYGTFWPPNASFSAPTAGIRPGETAGAGGRQGPMRVATGVLVVYSDNVSFAYMTPEGHPFAGWITFSSEREEDGTTGAQVQMIIRPSDPLYELGFIFGGSRAENRMWEHTLRSLAEFFGVTNEPVTTVRCVDKRRQWRRFGQVWHNNMIRTTLGAPFRALRRH